MKTLTEDKTQIVNALGVLDQIDSTDVVQFSVVTKGGETLMFDASPEIMNGMKSGLTGSLFGKTQDWQQDLQFSDRNEVATALNIEPDQLDGLAAHGADERIRAEDIVPFLHQSANKDASASV